MSTTQLVTAQADTLIALAQHSAYLADTVQVPSVTPPGSEKFMRIPGIIKWAVTLLGVTMLIASGGVMALDKLTDHSVGSKGMKIAGWSLVGGIIVAIAPQLYGFINA
ncbi:MAG: hypothetical protein WAW85_11700 [Gordonia sp. (in: high G+C Gram-positive bacteria)]|uniref:hypothetical protein n=1 Tax=Gordonia sp. (in: high G+C Gram-positive bacteria) TaxID=84139 RepID=UPI003BB4E49E